MSREMWCIILMLLPNLLHKSHSMQMWDLTVDNCPLPCTCQLQHLTETAIYRFMQDKNPIRENSHEAKNSAETNDVIYEEDNLSSEFLEEKQIIRSAICIVETNVEIRELCDELPENLEALTFIQGYYLESKTVSFSCLSRFKNLISLEMIGSTTFNRVTNSTLIAEIDMQLNLKYINLENVLIRNSKEFGLIKEHQTFEYVQKINSDLPSITMLQQEDDIIVPFDIYKKEENSTTKIPIFTGFKKLLLLRINHCQLNNLHWTMFDGLNNLQYLIIDNNNIKFIPPFAFYGCPNLKSLSLSHNNLLDIQLTDLAGLLEVEYLDLSFNNFSQLSELSLPPFPKLKLANFGNNPITIIFPNTFQVMNTTDSLIIGSTDVNLSLMANSFLGLNLLKALTLNNLNIETLTRDLFVGLPNLNEITLTGNITKIDFDTFLDANQLIKLTLRHCHLKNISMDAFIGLQQLEMLDLSHNNVSYLPAGVFDHLIRIKEIYLEYNLLTHLPSGIFSKIHPKLLRLNQNPWHCSCEMSEWKPIIINRIKQNVIKSCSSHYDKNVKCTQQNAFTFKYIYENKMAPKCAHPAEYRNWSVFHYMKKILKCPEFKPKLKKKFLKKIVYTTTTTTTTIADNTVDRKSIDDMSNQVLPISQVYKHQDKKYLKQKIRQIMKQNAEINNDIYLLTP